MIWARKESPDARHVTGDTPGLSSARQTNRTRACAPIPHPAAPFSPVQPGILPAFAPTFLLAPTNLVAQLHHPTTSRPALVVAGVHLQESITQPCQNPINARASEIAASPPPRPISFQHISSIPTHSQPRWITSTEQHLQRRVLEPPPVKTMARLLTLLPPAGRQACLLSKVYELLRLSVSAAYHPAKVLSHGQRLARPKPDRRAQNPSRRRRQAAAAEACLLLNAIVRMSYTPSTIHHGLILTCRPSTRDSLPHLA